MKKFLLSMALVLCTIGAMAQTKSIEFKVAPTGTGLTDIPVTVTVDGVATDKITATLSASANGVTALKNISNVVCFDGGSGNSNAATVDNPQIYTLTINGLEGTLSNISISNKALTGGGDWQGEYVTRRRHYNVSYGKDANNLTFIEDRIDLISISGTNGSVERAKDFAVADAKTSNPFVVQLKLYNVTDAEKVEDNDAQGCYFGLTGFTLTVAQEEVVEPEPVAYTLTQVASNDLMSKTTATKIAIKNLSYTNNRWFVGNTGGTPYSKEEFSDDAAFIWEPAVADQAGSYYLRKLNGDYMQTSSPKDFGTIDEAAIFTATAPGTGVTFNGDADSKLYITGNNDANLVRFVKGSNWINVQNGAAGTPTYNTGTGGWTIHYVYELTETTAYTTTITDAGYATFYAPAEVEIPENVKAYYVTVDDIKDGYTTMTEIANVIPANTAVILKGAEGEYTLNVSDTDAAAVSGNLLKGTITSTNVIGDAYILSKQDGETGLYKTAMTEVELSAASGKVNVFLNNANKAYLPASALPAAAQASNGFRFGEGTTGVENVTTENGNVKTIFDLTGRRVEEITTPGIYIVNGKKVLVK